MAAAVPETHILVVDDPEYLEEALSEVYELRSEGMRGGRLESGGLGVGC